MTVREQEDLIRGYDHEWAFVWNSDGHLVLAKEGAEYQVEFSDQELHLMKEAVVTHNHPHGLRFPDTDPRSFGNSFSEDDIRLACAAEVTEMRVVTPKLRFSMKPSQSGWDRDIWQTQVAPSFATPYEAVWSELMSAFTIGVLTSAEADATIMHETWNRVANELNLVYTREEG